MAELDERVAVLESESGAISGRLEVLQGTVEEARQERRDDHATLVTKLDTFMLGHEGRVVAVEQSTKSAHHRINWIYGLIAAGIMAIAAIAFAF